MVLKYRQMLRLMLRVPLVLALAVFTLSCSAGEQVPTTLAGQDRASDEAAIRAHVAAHEAALNQRDAAAVANLYTTEGDLIVYDGRRVVGREAIRGSLQTDFSTQAATMRIRISVTNVRFLTPDLAIVETVATFNEGDIRENRGTAVVVREGGNWLHSALRVFVAQRS